jgi:hypothetical protein
MTGEERDRRDSRALEPELITDAQARAVAEARNGFRQYDAAIGAIHDALDRGSFKLRPSLILGLQREALAGISSKQGIMVQAALLLKTASTNRSART